MSEIYKNNNMSHDIYQELLTESEMKSIYVLGYSIQLVICVFGLPANILSFYILSRPQMKSSLNSYLQFLAAYDGLFLLSWIAWANSLRHQWLYICMCAMALGSAYTTIAVSAERFIAICYPLKARTLLSPKRSFLCNLFIVAFIFCMIAPCFFVQEYLNVQNEFILYLDKRFGSEGMQYFEQLNHTLVPPENFYSAKISSWVQLSVWTLTPIVAVTFFNICIFLAVRKAEKNRREMSQAELKEISLSKTVLAVVVVFLSCWTPWFIFRVIGYFGITTFREYFTIGIYSYVLMSLNSAANVIIYTFLRTGFRNTFLGLCRTRKNDVSVNTSITTRY